MRGSFLLVFFLTSCNAMQDLVPGGVCSWVEPERERANCTEIVVTTEADRASDELGVIRRYNDRGLMSFEEATSGGDVVSLRVIEWDARGRALLNESTTSVSATFEWDGCFAGRISQEAVAEDANSSEGSFTFRDGVYDSYSLVYSGDSAFTVLEYDSEWEGGRIQRSEQREDGELAQIVTYTYVPTGGLELRGVTARDSQGVQTSRTETLVGDDDRLLSYSEFDSDDELTFRSDTTHTDRGFEVDYDANGNGERDATDVVELDDEGRQTRLVRTYSSGDRSFTRTHTWVCE